VTVAFREPILIDQRAVHRAGDPRGIGPGKLE